MSAAVARAAPARFGSGDLSARRPRRELNIYERCAALEARLAAAEDVIRRLASEDGVSWLARHFDLTRAQALVILILSETYPRRIERSLLLEFYQQRLALEFAGREIIQEVTLRQHVSCAARKLRRCGLPHPVCSQPRGRLGLTGPFARALAGRLRRDPVAAFQNLRALHGSK